MASVRKRLERLEAGITEGTYETSPEVLLYCKHVENARREMDGLEPLPLTPEEEALDLEQERRLLEETIPAYRADPGWQGEESRAMLDSWERDARRRLQESEEEGDER